MEKLGPLRALTAAYGAALALLAIPVVGKLVWDIPAGDFLRDCPTMAGGPVYLGAISYLGVVLWGCTAAICFFAAAAERPGTPVFRGFWIYGAVFSLALLADDLLMLHEHLLPVYFGVSEYVLYAAYAIAGVVYLLRYRAVLLQANYYLLLLAFAWFALMVVIDRFEGTAEVRGMILFEDGTKLLGIVTWLLFHADLALARVRGGHS
jgi:hypothetical protein